LSLAAFARAAATLGELLDARQPPELRSVAVRLISGFPDSAGAALLLDATPSLPPEERRGALDALCSRAAWAAILLDRLESGALLASDLTAFHRQRLLQHRDHDVAARARQLLGDELGREQVVAEHQDVLTMSGDPRRGRELFQKTCAVCHQVEGVGNQVGPDLQPLRKRGAAFLLTNILDPNRELDVRYESYNIVDEQGRSYAGIIESESAAAIVIRQADGKSATIGRDQIAEMRASGKSLMPEGLERELDRESLADLIAYLID
jgi:putative heme-binding domain-containing protein